MRRWLLAIGTLLLLTSPTVSKGVHISCALQFTINRETNEQLAHTVWNFYLDDTSEKLVAESNGIAVKTVMYSDARIDAQLSDETIGPTDYTLFGMATDVPPKFSVFRTTGTAALVVGLLPKGAIVGFGDCKKIEGPTIKF